MEITYLFINQRRFLGILFLFQIYCWNRYNLRTRTVHKNCHSCRNTISPRSPDNPLVSEVPSTLDLKVCQYKLAWDLQISYIILEVPHSVRRSSLSFLVVPGSTYAPLKFVPQFHVYEWVTWTGLNKYKNSLKSDCLNPDVRTKLLFKYLRTQLVHRNCLSSWFETLAHTVCDVCSQSTQKSKSGKI